MAADGSITIDTRINNKGAEADLKALQAKAKSTAQQIGALDKQLGEATTKRSKLAEDLAKAKAEAQATAAALDEIAAKLDAARAKNLAAVRQEFPGISDAHAADIADSRTRGRFAADYAKSDHLVETLNKQEAKAAAIETEYSKQMAAIQQLEENHRNLESQMVREQEAAEAQAAAMLKAAEAAQRANQFQRADDSMQAYFSKQEQAVERSFTRAQARQNKLLGIEPDPVKRAEATVQSTQREIAAQDRAAQAAEQRAAREEAAAQTISASNQKAFALSIIERASNAVNSFGSAVRGAFSRVVSLGKKAIDKLGEMGSRFKVLTDGIRRFGRRVAEIASGALFFNLLSRGLSNMTNYLGSALTASGALRTALANLSGAAQTAAAPIIQILTPALATLANAAATVFSYIARLVAFLTGTTVSAAAGAAAGIAAVGSAASGTASEVKKATRSLAGFDEITRLDAPQEDASGGGGGGGGGAGAIAPNFDFQGKNPFLDSLLAAIEAGDWFKVGRLIGEKLRDSLNAIPWPDIQEKARKWAQNLADTVNGFITTPGLWEAIGHTIAQGLNTVTTFVDTFFQGVWWVELGAGLARGLTQLVAEVNWEQLGRTLTDGLRAVLLTLHGFVTTYTGWETLGLSIAAMIGAALANIDWVQAAGDLSQLAIGLLTTLNTALSQIDWSTVGQTILGMLMAIDWAGLFGQLAQLFANTWPLLLTAVVIPAILSWIAGTLIPAIVTGIGSVLSAITAAIGGWPVVLIAAIAVVFGLILKAVIENWDAITAWLAAAWDSFVDNWNEFWNLVATNAKNWWHDITTGWTNFWNQVAAKFTAMRSALSGAWTAFWGGLASGVASIWDGIVSTVTGAVNALIGLINGMLSAVGNGLNGAINMLNSLSVDTPDWLPGGMGGKHLGFSISHITVPQIPALARGAVIPPNREFLAVLGDQSSGTNVEAPLATIQQAVADVMQDLQGGQMAGFETLAGLLRELVQAVYGIQIGDEVIGRAANRYRLRQAVITGKG